MSARRYSRRTDLQTFFFSSHRNENRLIENYSHFFMGAKQKKSVIDSLHTQLCFFAFFDISSFIENCMVMYYKSGTVCRCIWFLRAHNCFAWHAKFSVFCNHYIDPSTGIIPSHRNQFRPDGSRLGSWTTDAARRAFCWALSIFRMRSDTKIKSPNAFCWVRSYFEIPSNGLCLLFGKFTDSLLAIIGWIITEKYTWDVWINNLMFDRNMHIIIRESVWKFKSNDVARAPFS